MADASKFLELFQNTPPRLFPDDPADRIYIESFLAQFAVTNPGAYEERFAVYNAMCDKAGVPRFGRILVVKQEEAPVVVTPKAPVEAAKPVVVDTDTPLQKLVKKSKKSSPSA